MKVIGKPNAVVRPVGTLSGAAGNIPITSVSCAFALGSIPTCRVGIVAEYLSRLPAKATNDLYTVTVGDRDGDQTTIFTGYLCGPSGRKVYGAVTAGVDLIHPARDMDQMRLSSSNSSTSGIADFSYTRAGDGAVVGQSEDLGGTEYFSSGKGMLGEQIVNGIIKALSEGAGGEENRNGIRFKTESYEPAIKLLSGIVSLNGSLSSEIGDLLEDPINDYMIDTLENSFANQRSIWDSLTEALSSVGLYFLCDNDGKVLITADASGFTAPKENFIGSDYITMYDFSSSFFRNIKEVNIIAQDSPEDQAASGLPEGFQSTVATYPEEADPNDTGASISLSMPAWLKPLTQSTASNDDEPVTPSNPDAKPEATPDDQDAQIERAQKAYAQSLFNQERDKFRTFSISGPLAPGVLPGTTVLLQPFSSVKSRNDEGATIDDASAQYYAFLYEVRHSVDVMSKTMTTNMLFKNVSNIEEGLTIDEHPIFTDVKPLALE